MDLMYGEEIEYKFIVEDAKVIKFLEVLDRHFESDAGYANTQTIFKMFFWEDVEKLAIFPPNSDWDREYDIRAFYRKKIEDSTPEGAEVVSISHRHYDPDPKFHEEWYWSARVHIVIKDNEVREILALTDDYRVN